MAPAKKGAEKTPKTPSKELIYRRGEYLALRTDDDGYFLCKAQQHVYASTGSFKIMWLSEMAHQAGTFIADYVDSTELSCIITHVRLTKVAKDTYKLPDAQKDKILKELKEVLDPEESEEEEDEEESEEEDEGKEEEEEEEKSEKSTTPDEEDSDEEPKAKRARQTPAKKAKKGKTAPSKSRPKPQVKATASTKAGSKGGKKKVVASKVKKASKKTPPKAAKPKKEKKVKEPKPEKPKKRRLTPEERANPNLLLEANPKVTVWEKNPLTNSNEKVPFVSPTAHSKLVFRAVAMNDMKLLQSLIDNTKNIDKVDYQYSLDSRETPIHSAVKTQNTKALQLLLKEVCDRDPKKPVRCAATRNLLKTAGTGRYSRKSLHIPAVRALSMSRGSKEGNNALTKDENFAARGTNVKLYVDYALSVGASKKTLDTIMISSNNAASHYLIDGSIGCAIRNGHRKLAATLLEQREKQGNSSFNVLAREVMEFDKEELRKASLREASIKKKSWDNHNITPLHCAAINPNTKYLSKLFSVLPEYGITDKNNYRPIHYAAACEGTGPLEYLMNRGVDPDEPNGSGFTPLMIACETGRAHNVDLLLRQAKAKTEMVAEKEDDDEEGSEDEEPQKPNVSRYGIGGIDRPIQKPNSFITYCPIHLAIDKNNAEVLKSLIKYGVDVHKRLSAGKNRLTPLMIAAAKGNMVIIKMLIKEKARVEEKDKLQRTPLIHAVMNGQAHVASYLLSLGASPNQADSSGNTSLHYAAAYGWYFCAKTLIQAGADPAKSNDWQVAPLGIAFLKGHMGIVDFLLQQPSIDINFQDEQGKTLVALACSSELMEGIADELTYLVNKKGADVSITDVNKNTPLHHLAQNDSINDHYGNVNKKCLAQSMQIAKVLISNGASGADFNEEGITPVMYAIEQGNTELVRLLIDRGGEFSMTTNEQGQNSLHLMAEKCMASDLASLLEILKKSTQKRPGKGGANILQQMAAVVDKVGYTPLLYACKAYRDWNGETVTNSNNNDEEDASESEEDNSDSPESDDDNDSDYDSNGGESRGRKSKKAAKRKQTAQGGNKRKQAKTDESNTSVRVDPTWNYGRKFMTALFDLCDAKIDVSVQEKKFASTDDIPKKESEKYENPEEAKYTPLHYLVAANREDPIKNKKGEVENYSPVLDLFMKRLIGTDHDRHNLSGVTPLIASLKQVTNRSQDCAKKLIHHEADCNLRSNVKSDHGATPLCIAVSSGCNLDVIEKLLKADIHLADTKHQNTPLHLAVSKDRSITDVLQVVEKLLKAGANVNAANSKGRTPLHMAVNANRGDSDATSELESFLVDHRADVLAKDHRGRLPIHYAFTKIGKYKETGRTDPIELCTTLASYMAHQPIDVPDKRGQTPLHLAARRGAGVCCTVLVQKRCNINAKDKAGNTPLTLAAINGHESCSIMLIQKNAAINVTAVILPSHQLKEQENKSEEEDEEEEDDSQASDQEEKAEAEEDEGNDKEVDSEDETEQAKPNPWVWKVHRKKRLEPKRYPVFQVCVKNNWPGVIYMMLEVMDEANLTVNNTIEAALNTGQYNLALTLMRKFKDDRKFRETNRGTGRTLFHTLAVKVKPNVQEDLLLRVANELLRRSVPLNSKDHYGCKPLHYAALMHNTALIKFIIENIPDLDVNESDRYGRTPMAAAFWTFKDQSLPIYQSLFELNAGLNDQYSFPDLIMHFGKVPRDERNASEVEAEYVTEQKSVRCTPLIRAIQMQDFDMVKRLLTDGADPNARDSLQRVPLVHAIRRNNVNLVKLLLNHSYNLPGEDVTEVEYIQYTEDTAGNKRKKKAVKRPRASGRPQFVLLGTGRVADSDEEGDKDNENEEEQDEEEARKSKKSESTDINLSKFKAFRNVSGVKLTVLDQQGWSLVHHVVAPVEEATYDNVEMLKLLSDAGAPLGEKDMTGLTPLDYALRQNAPNLAKGLQKLTGFNKGHWDKPTLRSVPSVSDGLVWTTPKPNFNADAAALVKKYEDSWMEEEPDNRPEPDSELEMDDTGEVEMDTEQDLAYDVVLTKVDVQGNSGWGQFNFYIMQVVKHKAKDLWILFNRWGSIGDNGQFQRTPFGKRDDALKEFCKIFKAKTGNDWKNVKTFEAQPKKYRVVDPEDRRKRKNLRDIKLNLKSTATCHLPDTLSDLMKEIMDPHMLRSAYDEGEVDSSLIPFSRMRKETIMKAVALLNKLRPITDELEEMRNKDLYMGDNIEKYKDKFKEVVNVSNQIYQLIPDRGYAFQTITVLARPDEVQSFSEKLINLAELELASRITAGAMHRRNEIHPAEYLYRSIGTTLRTMNPDEIEAQYLLKFLSTGMNVEEHYRKCDKIEAIFEVNRPGEQQRINRCHLENHKLLFHGTKASNLISILHRGLLIAPPGALISGHLHGKGIYFSDMFDKSADYCHNWYHSGTTEKHKYMLICEVALGDAQVTEHEQSDELSPYNCRLVPGKSAPRSNSDVKLRDGCILPLGDRIERKAKDKWWLPEYSEYIVFAADQARVRYLVKFA